MTRHSLRITMNHPENNKLEGTKNGIPIRNITFAGVGQTKEGYIIYAIDWDD